MCLHINFCVCVCQFLVFVLISYFKTLKINKLYICLVRSIFPSWLILKNNCNLCNVFQLITIGTFSKLLKNHPDYVALKLKCFQDVKDIFKDFLIINETGVSLKNVRQLTTNKCNSPIDNKGMYNF